MENQLPKVTILNKIDKLYKLGKSKEITQKKQEENVLAQIEALEATLHLIKFKQWYYETAVKDKTDQFVKNMKYEDMPPPIQDLYNKSHKS